MFIDYDFYSAVSVSSILFKKKGKKRRQKHRKDKKNLDNLKIIFRISKSFLKKLFFQSSLYFTVIIQVILYFIYQDKISQLKLIIIQL